MGQVTLIISPPRSGKTSSLLHYARSNPSVGGWLCPDVGTWRMLVEFPGENWQVFQTEDEANATTIGRFRFRNEVISHQEERLKAQQFQAAPQCKTWIIDEVGPLELRDQLGWSHLIDFLYNEDQQGNLNFDLVIVVRMGYESAFVQRWPFSELKIESLESFNARFPTESTLKIGASLTGLVLVGGKSERMSQSKALLRWEGHPLYRRTALLMSPFCKTVYLGVNPAMMTDFPDWPCLYDDLNLRSEGPLTALLAAWQNLPLANWVVLSCDYPTLSSKTLREFIQAWDTRSPLALLADDQRPNPLMAIYPAWLFPLLKSFYREGGKSLRMFLEEQSAKVISLKFPPISVDTPQQWHEITGQQLPDRSI